MTVDADGYLVVARLLPPVELLPHDVAVDARDGVVAEIRGRPARRDRIAPGPQQHPAEHAEQHDRTAEPVRLERVDPRG